MVRLEALFLGKSGKGVRNRFSVKKIAPWRCLTAYSDLLLL